MRNQYQLSGEDEQDILDNLTPGTSQQMAPVKMAPPAPVLPIGNNQPQKPPLAPNIPVREKSLPGMPPSVTPDEIEKYLSGQKQTSNQYGADERLALQDSLNARKDSFGYKATEGLKGLGDAVMMGVAGAGNPGWQSQFRQDEQQNAQDQIGALKDARSMNKEDVAGNMTLDQMDPASPMSKEKQKSYAPLFQKLGYPPGKLEGMSASNIDNAVALMTQYGGKEIEAMIKQFEMQMQQAQLGALVSHQKAEENMARDKNKADVAKDVLNSRNSRILGVPIPFTNPVSGKAQDAAQGVIDEQLGGSDEPTITFTASDGSTHTIYSKNIDEAKKRDPGLQVQ